MVIKSAKFLISNTDVAKCPNLVLPEYAFIGRSNVGKSSLINMLTEHKKLAMTSAKPGKTQLINHFIINEEWYLVDLPGYGYARQSKKNRASFGKIISFYLEKREMLTNLFILIDIRLEPQSIDLEFINSMGEMGIPFALVFTKQDKISKSEAITNVANYKARLLQDWEEVPPVFVTSAKERTGRDELLAYIEDINNNLPPTDEVFVAE